MSHSSSSSSSQNVISFEEAMAKFGAMFPDLDSEFIESVLRKNVGDVCATIDELLGQNREERGEGGGMKTRRKGEDDEEEDGRGRAEMKKGQRPTGATRSAEGQAPAVCSSTTRDPCADDEKIALLIQNREFLRFLRNDPRFQREVLAQDRRAHRHHHAQRSRGHALLPVGPAAPMLVSCSRAAHSPNTRRLFSRANDGKGECPRPVPNGPHVAGIAEAQQELAIPEGPIVDYVDSEHSREPGWGRKLKAKLISERKLPPTAEQLQPSPLVHYSDSELQESIRGMGGGRGLLLGLARKFSQLGRNGHNQRVRLE